MNLMPLVSESLNLIWPARCAGCDARPVPEAALFCAPCSLALNALCGVCPGCALPRHDDPRELVFAGKRCRRCLRVPLPFTTGNACFEYGETIARAIVRMKHGKRRELARRLARLMIPALADLLARAKMGPGRRRGAGAAAPREAARARVQPGARAGALRAHRAGRARPS
jgi:predicted amidophosphoribosyltransferase